MGERPLTLSPTFPMLLRDIKSSEENAEASGCVPVNSEGAPTEDDLHAILKPMPPMGGEPAAHAIASTSSEGESRPRPSRNCAVEFTLAIADCDTDLFTKGTPRGDEALGARGAATAGEEEGDARPLEAEESLGTRQGGRGEDHAEETEEERKKR